ncbi:hypothetical protein GCM10008956_36800 [Deinococcus arenae]|uniref:Uncharacterized protein n=1 Tax=Deinococcus arenae TaxID=1452751 RepID=A0A8H9L7U0_9DEIO|nr:hypothetical protein [Deinococcus arenae]AWT34846.1 hypothetical protein DM785_04180 [Deinococcus actinosclerus]GGM57741.1 hypothetical protein GCM10008956_36800 [Deinococcus arenae]
MTSPHVQVEFQAAQRWTYRTRPGEDTSTVLILRRDDEPNGTALHVTLDRLRLGNPHLPGGVQMALGHAPVTADALRASVLELIQVNAPLPADEGGYRQWREAADRGEAGVFTLTLAEILDVIGQAVAPALPGELFGKTNRR